MSILQRNLINSKQKNIFGEKEPNVFFNDEIKSIKLSKYYFTNFIDSKKSPLVSALKNERRKILKKEVDYDRDYEIKNIEYRKSEQKKIKDILDNTTGNSNINYAMLFRLKNIYNPAIQFFFLDDLNGNYEILLIDIYHLVLPAPDKSHHEWFANPKKTYKEHEKASFDLSNIFHK